MEHETKQIQGNITEREDLRRVLLGQYMFHEARHYLEPAGGATELVPTVPKAHTLADIYKCLHQGEFGIGHSIDDPVRFAKLLASDLLRAELNSTEPVLENVSARGSVFRVNLRPYRQRLAGRDEWASSLLVEACLSSAARHTGSAKHFMVSLEWFRDLNDHGELAIQGRSYMFPNDSVGLFLAQVNEFIKSTGSIPVLGHSPIYKKYNAPSYRVVDGATLERSALAFLLPEAQ